MSVFMLDEVVTKGQTPHHLSSFLFALYIFIHIVFLVCFPFMPAVEYRCYYILS